MTLVKNDGQFLKNKSAQTIKDFVENILKTSKTETNLKETNEGSEIVNKIFTNLLYNKNIKRSSRSLEILPWEQFLLRGSTLLSEICVKDQFSKTVLVIGLILYP